MGLVGRLALPGHQRGDCALAPVMGYTRAFARSGACHLCGALCDCCVHLG